MNDKSLDHLIYDGMATQAESGKVVGSVRQTEKKMKLQIEDLKSRVALKKLVFNGMTQTTPIFNHDLVGTRNFFIKQMSLILGNANIENVSPPSHGYSAIVGIFLVGLGTLISLLAFVRYKKVERQIDEDTYQPSPILDMLLTISVLAVGIFLVIYLIHST